MFWIDIKSESKVTPEDLVWDYVPEEPEAPAEDEINRTLHKILDILFRILRVLLSIFGLYIAPEL